MPVEIRELVTNVDVVDAEALLSPEVLDRIVTAVLARLASREQSEHARASELRVESVVQQQRTKAGG